MPVQTEEFFEKAATEVASDMAMVPVQTSMPVISQVTAHVTIHCTSMSYLSCQFYVTGFHVWRNDMLMMSQLSSTMMSQMQAEVSVTII